MYLLVKKEAANEAKVFRQFRIQREGLDEVRLKSRETIDESNLLL